MEISHSRYYSRRITDSHAGDKIVAGMFWHPHFSGRNWASFSTELMEEYKTLSIIIFSYITS